MNGGIMQIIKILLIMVQTNLCPMSEGLVVYQARAFYTMLFDTVVIFDDSHCYCTVDSFSARMAHVKTDTANAHSENLQASKQSYWLYPDPNNGNITIQQKITDKQLVSVRVRNAAGVNIYQGALQFNDKKANLQLKGVSAGLYILQLIDAQGNSFGLKFTVF